MDTAFHYPNPNLNPSLAQRAAAFSYPVRPRILACEDDEDLAQALRLVLGRAYEFQVESTARHALETYEIEPPDLLLLDYALPDMNGLRLYSALLRRHEVVPPTVMLSALGSRRAACLGAGMQVFIEKPYNNQELVFAIESALRRC